MRKNEKNTQNSASSKNNITSIHSKLKIHMPDQAMPNESVPTFGEVIKKYRNLSGISQTSLAEMMETSRNTIINWESDKSRPDINNIRELCLLLGIPLSELFNLPAPERTSTKEKTMLSQFRKLSAVSQKVVTRMINSMFEEETDARDEYLRSSFTILPLQATPAAAGTGCEFTNIAPSPLFIRKSEITEAADTIIRVSGPSMEPLYHDGDLLYVEYTNTVEDGYNVVCSTADGAVVKQKRDNKLYSLNAQYPYGEKYEDDNVTVLGKVIGIVGKDDLPAEDDSHELETLLSRELREFHRKYGE